MQRHVHPLGVLALKKAELKAGGNLSVNPVSMPGRVINADQVLAATFLVLACTSDDIIVLTPFFHGRKILGNSVVYMTVMVMFWLLSFLVMLAANACDSPRWPTEQICEYGSIILLSFVTYKFFRDWFSDNEDDDNEELEDGVAEEQESKALIGAAPDTQYLSKKKSISFLRLFELCVAINFDNLAVYLAVLLNGTLTPLELLLGDIIAASIVTMILLGLGQLKFVTTVCSYVPTWLILAPITIYMIVHHLASAA